MIGVASLLLRKRLLGGAAARGARGISGERAELSDVFSTKRLADHVGILGSQYSLPSPISMATASPDLAVADSLTHSVSLWKGSGNGQFTLFSKSPITLPLGTSGPYVIATGDLNGDKKIDLIVE